MTTEEAIQKIWDYMLMHQQLKKADLILVLGNCDTRVAEHAAQLYFDGWAPVILFTGSGSIHNRKPGREQFVGSTEAEVFAGIAIKKGVPKESIILENESQNTGQNYQFALAELKKRNIRPQRVILVHAPYAERRVYATGKVWLPEAELIVSSPPIPLAQYPVKPITHESFVNAMVGDFQRIREYPRQGFQIEQEIPEEVWQAYQQLVNEGYDEKLIPGTILKKSF